VKDFDESVSLRDNLEERSLKHRRRCVSMMIARADHVASPQQAAELRLK
jgi:hypothetical protein